MDIAIAATDGSAVVELRNARLVDCEGHYGALVRLRYEGRQYKRPFWFDRSDVAEFLKESRWLRRSISGEALLPHAGRSDFLLLSRKGGAWQLGGKVLQEDHPDMHVRFTLPISSPDVDRFLSACTELMASATPD